MLDESTLPVSEEVAGACEVLGLDPLYVACEGRFLAFVPEAEVEVALRALRRRPDTARAARIGTVGAIGTNGTPLAVRTSLGSLRALDLLSGEQLPRIC